ncbi:UrvD/REP family ATP-dependent DNA helicase [Ornithinimicrobium pratense]|uniref:DNA 3'-5' helicase n=1 Tax=Ornithinimicrobium pratense TaxID=2593973 RepID=A0A5J6V6E7_9MICO|nr:UrvD/REP family ATP-dependent DNA helicase [Ornithinimicrobium pratense]QFG69177.1 ATP-dependent helicase [Ornithinimicrobium pratense]
MSLSPRPRLDAGQATVVGHRDGVLLVLGAPGTGRTTALVEHVRHRVGAGTSPDRCLVLAPTRPAAARLRTQIGSGLGRTHTEPMARTAASLAFAVLRLAAARSGEPGPRLISGAEQDVVLRELLIGHQELGTGPRWPERLVPALPTTGFRAQLRDLLMRAVEHGLAPADLEELAQRQDRPEWACAAQVLAEYDQVTALSDPGSYDPAWICTAAADALEDDEELRWVVQEQVEVVVVDDAQELTASAVRLLDVLRPASADAVLAGDPDAAAQGFRGALPGAFVDLASRWHERSPRTGSGEPAQTVPTVLLRHRHGSAGEVARVADRVAERVGVTSSRAHRRPEPGSGPGDVSVALARSAAQEAAHVARWLRRAHLVDGVPWEELVVLARSGRQQETVRRALATGGVPVHLDRSGVPLGQDPAVLPFLLAFDIVTRGPREQDAGRAWWVTPEEAVELLGSPLGGLDPLALRRLRRRVRAAELAAGGTRRADELLAELVSDPQLWRAPDSDVDPGLDGLARVGRVLEAGAAAHHGSSEGPQGTAEEVLWALWRASAVARLWASQALSGGALGARADRDLDAMLVLFGAAESFVERLPGSRARSFLTLVRSAEVASDTLVVGARRQRAVEVLTPQAAAGRRWRRAAIVGVQEGVWPDLRLRDTLLGAEALVAALQGRAVEGAGAWRAAQAQVRADELRQFHVAVTRAREALLVTATSSTEEQPSVLLDLVDPDYRDHPPVEVPAPMTLRGLVGEMRRTAVRCQREGDLAGRDRAVDLLARLDAEGVAGAGPGSWWQARDVSVDRSVRPDGPVRVSPSKVQTFQDCQLRWFLTARGAETGEARAAEIGTLVHAVIADAPSATVDELCEDLLRRWPDLELPTGWVADRALGQAQEMLGRYATYVREAAAAGRELLGTELELAVTVPDGDADLTAAQHGAPDGVGGAQPDGRAESFAAEADRAVRLVGAVDRLERDGQGRLVVVDLKTGRTKPTQAEVEEHAQLMAYQVAVEAGAFDAGTTSGGARLVQLGAAGPVAQEQPPLGDRPDPDAARRLVLEVGTGMRGARFTAHDLERRCRSCPARFACPLQPEGAQR